MKKPTILVVIVQMVLFAVAWRSVAPEETDFSAFYATARLYQRGENPYDLQKQCDEELNFRGGECLPFAHPPVLLPLISLVSSDNYAKSYNRWLFVLLVVLGLCLIPLYNLSKDWGSSLQSIVFIPIFIALTLGQDTPFVLLGALLWVWLLNLRKDFLAGLALSLTVVKPQIAILLALPLLLSRLRTFAGFAAGAVSLTLLSYLVVGAEGFRKLLELVQVMGRGKGYGIKPEAMFNVTGLLVRAGISPAWAWAFFAIALLAITILWRRYGTTIHSIGIGIVITTFCAPHLHFHDLSLLAIPVLFIHPLAPALASMTLLISHALNLEHGAAYALMIYLAVMNLKRIKAVPSLVKRKADLSCPAL